MVLDPIPQSLPVHFFGSRPQPPTSHGVCREDAYRESFMCVAWLMCVCTMTLYMCTMTHSHQGSRHVPCRDSIMCSMTHSCSPWLIHVFDDTFTGSMTHSCVPWLIHMFHDSFIRLLWLIPTRIRDADMCKHWDVLMCGTIHSCVLINQSLTQHSCAECWCVTWILHLCCLAHLHQFYDSDAPGILTQMCALTHSYAFHDSAMCVPWLIHMFSVTRQCVCHDSGIPGFATQICVMPHSYVLHDLNMCVPWLINVRTMTY